MSKEVEHYKRAYAAKGVDCSEDVIDISHIQPSESDKTIEWLNENFYWDEEGLAYLVYEKDIVAEITTYHKPHVRFSPRHDIFCERHVHVKFLGNSEQKIPKNLADFLEMEKFEKVED